MQIVYSFMSSLLEELPSIGVVVSFSFLSLVYGYALLYVAGSLKIRGVRTGYTRKIVHFAIFGTVALVQSMLGLVYVFILGFSIGIVILYTLIKGDRNILYESIAREKDAPNRTRFIIFPFLATAVGGLSANMLFGDMAIFGYLVAGIGDAAGEPVGVRFGKHRLFGMMHKTVEGTVAVLLGSFGALLLGLLLIDATMAWQISFSLAFLFTVVEVISPRGLDNFFMQFVPSLTLFFIL